VSVKVENIEEAVAQASVNEHCSVCNVRLRVLFSLVGPKGPVFDLPGVKVKRRKITDVVVITKETLFSSTSGKCKHGVPYQHYNLRFVKFGQKCNNDIVKTYLPLCRKLFDQISSPGIKESLDMLIGKLPNVMYGSTLLPTTNWLRRNVKEVRLSDMELVKAIMDGDIHGKVHTSYHQASKNIVDAMNTAHDIEALGVMMKERLSPNKYMRPKSGPSDGNIEQALRLLGDFTVTAMTKEMLSSHGAVILPGKSPSAGSTSAAEVWKKQSRTGAAGLASRSSSLIPGRMTVGELMARIKSGEITSLSVKTTGCTPLHVLSNTLSQKKGLLDVPHTWSFTNNSKAKVLKEMGIFTWMDVAALHTWERCGKKYFFIALVGAKPQEDVVGCFPSLLCPDIQRQCRRAFESLNKSMHSIVLTGSLAGIGTNSEAGKWSFIGKEDLHFQTNGKDFSVCGF